MYIHFQKDVHSYTHTHRATSVVNTYACDSCICITVWDDCWNIYVRSSRPLDTKNHFLTRQHNFVSKIRIFAIIVADTALTYETHSAQYLPSHGTQLIQHSRMRPTVHSISPHTVHNLYTRTAVVRVQDRKNNFC